MDGTDFLQILIYLSALLLVWVPYGLRRHRRSARNRSVLRESRELGLMEPASLHPRIDESQCIGCGACVTACPEEDVLGLIGGKAQLVRAANCIGHGACQRACPVDAIELVFGTETRGIEIPVLAPDFQTNVPGLFIAGELGGMGLIRNAIEQGRQAVESARKLAGSRARRRARPRDRRRRAGGILRRVGGQATPAACGDARAGDARGRGGALSAREDRDDGTRRAPPLREARDARDQQGVVARAMARRRTP